VPPVRAPRAPRTPVTPESRPQLPNEVWRVIDRAEQHLDRDLTWVKALSPADRDQLNLVIETAVADFVSWLNTAVFSPHKGQAPSTDHIFFVAPLEFTQAVSLRQTLDVTRLIVDILERNVGAFARRGREEATRNAMLYYAREVAFSAANVYAASAEARSDWDARLETLIVEDLADGVTDHHVASRMSMLGWNADADCFALAGTLAQDGDLRSGILERRIRAAVRSLDGMCMMSHHDNLFLTLIAPSPAGDGSEGGAPEELCSAVSGFFLEDRPLCMGPVRHGIDGAAASVRAVLSTMAVANAADGGHRPLRSDDVLPERALFGDADAREELYREVYRPLRGDGDDANPLLATVAAFLRSGGSLEATARELNVHPNTVRYRLKRSVEITGWDPMTPREAYVLLTALTIGRIMDAA
ncbi:PucR family transcriptional regulator, partial [Bifidobacterium sp. DSM 109958]